MSQMKITYEEANHLLEVAFPKQGVTFRKPEGPSGAYKVLKANGEVIGQAFDLRTALRQAVQPVLKQEAQRRLDEDAAKVQDFKDFHRFLRERHNDEFEQWKQGQLDANAAVAGLDTPGPELGAPRLVPELPEQR